MAGLTSLSAEFVIEDGLNTRVLGIRVVLNPDDPRSMIDQCHAMGRKLLAEAVASTSMLAKVRTHPDDSEDPQKNGTAT